MSMSVVHQWSDGIQANYAKADKLSNAETLAALQGMNHALQHRLAVHDDIPHSMRSYRIGKLGIQQRTSVFEYESSRRSGVL